MNKNNAAQYLPLVQALADGKSIQYQLDEHLKWRDVASPDFTMAPECYRIKPEPREIWVNESRSGCHIVFGSESEAVLHANTYGLNKPTRRYREVLE